MRRTVAIAFFLVACSNNVGPNGPAVGGPCFDTFDCGAGSFCLTGPQFPDGTCSRNCSAMVACPSGSACIDMRSGSCVLRCSTSADCRAGYACVAHAIVGGVDSSICLAP